MDIAEELSDFVEQMFGVDDALLLAALKVSPSARGYIMGAISELALSRYMEDRGFEVLRIVEKPSGGNLAKSAEARGDFYIRKKGTEGNWLVIESKGLKSNSEFRGAKLDSPQKVFKYLKKLVFPTADFLASCYDKGLRTYNRAKKEWEAKNPGGSFPPFRWDKSTPGAMSCSLQGIWKNEEELKAWVDSQLARSFEEKAYRAADGPIAVLETHKPSKRKAPISGIDQAAPLVADFNILAVDLFLRTGVHEFAFVNAETISHSPSSPEHLYQNYTIDILVKGKKTRPVLSFPWFDDLDDCINATHPTPRELDESQLDRRFGEIVEEYAE